jgi:hypothetical protein
VRNTPSETSAMPATPLQPGDSPSTTRASAAICSSIVLLIPADSTADRLWSDRFHQVKANAVFTTASQMIIVSALSETVGQRTVGDPSHQQRRGRQHESHPSIDPVTIAGRRPSSPGPHDDLVRARNTP